MNTVTSINDDDHTLIKIQFKYIDYVILTARHSEFSQIFCVFLLQRKHLSFLVSFVTAKYINTNGQDIYANYALSK